MSRKQPTASVSGRMGWEWNRLQQRDRQSETSADEHAEASTNKQSDSTSDTASAKTTKKTDRSDRNVRQKATAEKTKTQTTESATKHRCQYRDENIALQRRVKRLEAQLERKDKQLQNVVNHYECLLAEQKIRETPQKTADGSPAKQESPELLSRVVRYLDRR